MAKHMTDLKHINEFIAGLKDGQTIIDNDQVDGMSSEEKLERD